MKAKYIILLFACAVVTLSFTVSTHKTKAIAKTPSSETANIGGLASEDPIK